jgi:6-hydroxycyclohex-1-ene-1-carbonyl-CoA dehydrogenase
MSTTANGWMMTEPGRPLEEATFELATAGAGEAIIEVAGCGLCHTDISFLHMGVKTRAALPLVLGHEISGLVREVGDGVDPAWIGRPVIVPAVMPCGTCALCTAGHRTICKSQIMPGNDRHGGFASHVAVPARYLCGVDDDVLATTELWRLSVVADAVSTPYMSVKRAELTKGELAIVVGAGGIGIYCVQCAVATGAKVIALDVSADKLELARQFGASAISVTGLSDKELKARVREEAKSLGAPPLRWKIFETSGTAAGQQTAFGLLNHGAYMAVVGFTMDKLEVRLSNLMAFDATLRGNWGCDPELYPEILSWVAQGKVKVTPLTKKFPLSQINEAIDMAHHGKLRERAVLVPE